MSKEDAANCLLFLHQLQRHLGVLVDVQTAAGEVPVVEVEQCMRRVSKALDRKKSWRRQKEVRRARRRIVELMEEEEEEEEDTALSSTLSASSDASSSVLTDEVAVPIPIVLPRRAKEEEEEEEEKGEKKRFSRVQGAEFADERLRDNSFTGRPGSYGERAHHDLLPTKGKGFTKEKNKKKRGSYRGGAIDFGSNSFKFE